MYPEPHLPLQYGDGVYLGEKLSVAKRNKVSTDFKVFNETEDVMSFAYIKNVPAIIFNYSISAEQSAGTKIQSFPVCPTMCHWEDHTTYAQYFMPHWAILAHHFNFWRGSMKFMIVFTCSSFISGRFRILWVPSQSYAPTDLTEGGGDFVSIICDVKGDTCCTFSVPYCQQSPYKRTAPYATLYPPTSNPNYIAAQTTTCTNGNLMIFTQSDITGSFDLALTTIGITVYASCGEDMVFYTPRDFPQGMIPNSTGTRGRRMVGQMACLENPREVFKNAFPSMNPSSFAVIQNIVHGEEVTHLKTLMSRYTLAGVGDSLPVLLDWRFCALDPNCALNNLAHMYQFFRGGVRYQIQQTKAALPPKNGSLNVGLRPILPNDIYPSVEDDILDNVYGGCCYVYAPSARIDQLEFEIPFTCATSFLPVDIDNWPVEDDDYCLPYVQFVADVTTDTFPNINCYLACGDDFSLGWLTCPYIYKYTYPVFKPVSSDQGDNNNNAVRKDGVAKKM